MSFKFAHIANKMFASPLSADTAKEKLKAYKCSKNCEKLTVAKENFEVWKKLSKQPLSADLRYANVQANLVKVAVATGEALGLIRKSDFSRATLYANCAIRLQWLGGHVTICRWSGSRPFGLPSRPYMQNFAMIKSHSPTYLLGMICLLR